MKVVWFLALLISAPSAQAGLFDYWGLRAGATTVVSDNSDRPSGNNMDEFGYQFAGLCGFPVDRPGNLSVHLEAGVRYSTWHLPMPDRPFESCRPYSTPTRTSEVFYAPMIEYRLPLERWRPFIAAGVENGINIFAEPEYRYFNDGWEATSLSGIIGGGFVVPMSGQRSFVLDLRYNIDLRDQRIPVNQYATPTRFNELHFLIGMNFSSGYFRSQD